MRSLTLWIFATACARQAWAGSVKFRQAAQQPRSASTTDAPNPAWKTLAAVGNTDITLQSSRDLIYIADVTISGHDYQVQLDTGSSDLWVHTTSGVPNTQTTGLTYNLTYGIGYSYGNIVTAQVEFAGFLLPRQAFVDAVDAINPVLNLGAAGVLGLGFTGLSGVDAAVNSTNQAYGRSILFNIFAQDASVPNFISFLLSRSNDSQAPVEGSFTISEFDDQYTQIQNTPQIPTFPVVSPTRWNVLLDAFAADGKRFAVGTTVPGVASGKAVILLDTGTTFTYAPTSVVSAIFASLPGAKFNRSLSQWVLPCDTEVSVSLYIGGTQFDMHPLDMVVPGANNPSICVGSFIPLDLPIAEGEFDWLVGVNVLRSMYSVYDFGDPVHTQQAVRPYVQLLQLRTAAQMSSDFAAVRGGVPQNGTVNNKPTDGGSTVTPDQAGTGGGQTVLGDSSLVSHALSRLLTYMPAILGILGVNTIVFIALIIAAVVWLCCRKKRKAKRAAAAGATLPYTRVATADPEVGSLHKSLRSEGGATSPVEGLPALHAQAPPRNVSLAAQAQAPPRDASLGAPPMPRYDTSTLPRPPRGPDMGAPQYSSMTY